MNVRIAGLCVACTMWACTIPGEELGSVPEITPPPTPVTSAAADPLHAENLLANGDAEQPPGVCATERAVGWTAGGVPSVAYGTVEGDPVDGPPERGMCFFAATIRGGPPTVSASQEFDLSVAPEVAGGTVTYTAEGWFGGSAGGNGTGILALAFIRSGGASETAATQPVEADERGGRSAMVRRTISGKVPPDARTLLVTLALQSSDPETSETRAYADNLVVRLTP